MEIYDNCCIACRMWFEMRLNEKLVKLIATHESSVNRFPSKTHRTFELFVLLCKKEIRLASSSRERRRRRFSTYRRLIQCFPSRDYFKNINSIRNWSENAASWYSFYMICEIKVARCIKITSIKSPFSKRTFVPFTNALCGWRNIFNTFLSSS